MEEKGEEGHSADADDALQLFSYPILGSRTGQTELLSIVSGTDGRSLSAIRGTRVAETLFSSVLVSTFTETELPCCSGCQSHTQRQRHRESKSDKASEKTEGHSEKEKERCEREAVEKVGSERDATEKQ